ncbi:hypothetical protein [Methanoregula sp.]|uniref:hypothetical protein n=1 Tax=Methanoregula sp. TaxID=2052170 RepID=UPI003BB1FFA6
MNTPTGTKRKGSIPVVLAVIGILAMTGIAMADAPTVRSGPGMMYGYNQTAGYGYPGMAYGYNQTAGYGYPGMAYRYSQNSGYGYPGMMYGEGAWPGMMASGFFLFFAVLGALAMIVWLIVGILLIIWLAKKIRGGVA